MVRQVTGILSPPIHHKMSSSDKFLLWVLFLASTCHAASPNHETLTTFDMFSQNFHGGERDPGFNYRAFLGGIEAAEEFKKLHKPQAKEKLAQIVQSIDFNKDGVIEKEELIAHLRENLRKINVESAERRFGKIDKDDSGLVTKEEYIDFNFGCLTEHEKELKQNQEYIAHAEKMYDAADRDKDTGLSKNEYLAVHNPSNSKETEEIELEFIMGIMDLDKDGAISFQEAVKKGDEEAEFDLDDPEVEDCLIQFEEEVDHNRDGYARGFQELVNIIRPLYHFRAKDEAEHLIELADDNTNDQLSYQEILDKFELFAGSIETHKGVFHHEDEL